MQKKILLAFLFSGNIYAQYIDQANIIIHSYHLNRSGLWEVPIVSSTLKKKTKTNAILSLSGDIAGFEYQLKHESQTGKNKLQSLFYIVDINDNLSMQIGKFIENWQLGYNANPLNLTDPYHPSNNNDDINEKLGVNAIALRYVGDRISADLYAGNDKEIRNKIHGYGYKSQGLRLNYILNDDTDISLIVQKKHSVRLGIGAGFRHIANNNSKIYGSFFIRKGTTLASLNTETMSIDSYRTNDGKHYARSMLGWHWTNDDNFSIIAEISNDKRGMNKQEWDAFKNPLFKGMGLTLVRPNGLRQRYHFVRLGKIVDKHEFSLSRRTSTDNSALNILKWRYEINENLQLNASFSVTTGSADSEYKSYFPEQNKAAVILRYAAFF